VSFARLILKGLLRRRVRTALTVLGIAAGIATVVALGAITEGLRSTAGGLIGLGGTDFLVAQKGASDLSFSTVDRADVERIRAVEGVTAAAGVLMHITQVGDNPYFVLFGVDDAALAVVAPSLTAGAAAPGTALLGERAARDLGASVGSRITIGRRSFTVGGTYRSPDAFQDRGGYFPLDAVQDLAGKGDAVTSVYVTAAGSVETVAARIEDEVPGVVAITSTAEYGKVDQGIDILDAVNIAISALAIGIGAIGVMNTMVMSVFERTREIGVLRAVGWSRRRIVQLIVGESVALCFAAAVVGLAGGVLAAQAVSLAPAVGGLIEPNVEVATLLRAAAIAFGVALAGAAFPALRAARMTPIGALRYE
jgi:putative ABC transport system permease protein